MYFGFHLGPLLCDSRNWIIRTILILRSRQAGFVLNLTELLARGYVPGGWGCLASGYYKRESPRVLGRELGAPILSLEAIMAKLTTKQRKRMKEHP